VGAVVRLPICEHVFGIGDRKPDTPSALRRGLYYSRTQIRVPVREIPSPCLENTGISAYVAKMWQAFRCQGGFSEKRVLFPNTVCDSMLDFMLRHVPGSSNCFWITLFSSRPVDAARSQARGRSAIPGGDCLMLSVKSSTSPKSAT